MRGYTVKKGSRYYAVVYGGIDPITGKERRHWHAAGPRQGDADRLLTKLVRAHHEGTLAAPLGDTVAEYLINRWLPTQRARLRPSTFDSYRRNIELHVVPTIGRIRLSRLTPQDLDALYAHLLVAGNCSKSETSELSPKSVRYVHLILHKALADAARKGALLRNVASLADAPKLSARHRREMRAWTASQLRTFLEQIRSHRLYSAYFLAANTGMRRGEILGLRWSDVDLVRSALSVRQALVSVDYELVLSDVKTGAGRRSVDLDPRTVATLEEWARQRASERGELGMRAAEGELVFPRPEGTPIHPDYFSQVFDRAASRSGLPKLSLHDLRHTHATLMLQAGIPVKVVSERLGHASPAFTMTVYQHVLPGMQAEAAAAFSNAVFGSDADAVLGKA